MKGRKNLMTDQLADQWLQQYGKYVEEAPTIDFNGTLFVFTGLLDSPKDNPIIKKVIEKGGQYRTSVSGLTDYLVVNPSGSARYARTKCAHFAFHAVYRTSLAKRLHFSCTEGALN